MIISQARAQDEKDLVNVLEVAAIASRLFAKTGEEKYLEQATHMNQFAEKLKERIKSFDYGEWDESFKRVRQLDREFADLNQGKV